MKGIRQFQHLMTTQTFDETLEQEDWEMWMAKQIMEQTGDVPNHEDIEDFIDRHLTPRGEIV